MTRRRIVVIVSIMAALALFGGFVWPGFFNSSNPTPTLPAAQQIGQQSPAQPEPQKDESPQQQKERKFTTAIAKSSAFYNCSQNDTAKAARDASQLVPCGTTTTLITNMGDKASDTPMIVSVGTGDNNVVSSSFGPVPSETGVPRSGWTVHWTVGEGSQFLQTYQKYVCGDEGRVCWGLLGMPRLGDQNDYSCSFGKGTLAIALVFTNGRPGFPVPGEWWNKGTPFANNEQY